ncbi:hypothetical protein GCM10028857_23990 [Salinarchaeum chitinilyticum]
MDDAPTAPTATRLLDLDEPEAAERSIEDAIAELESAPADDRKATIRSLRDRIEADPDRLERARDEVEELLAALVTFLTDEERAVRLTTAKLFVAVARPLPEAVEPTVPALGERLADDEEFYFVRARAAEALGYVALASPDVVASPDTLADLTVGLAFDEPAVKTKLAKALEHVALGDPARLAHHAETIAEHVDDEDELVRYHCSTALAAIASERPDAVVPVSDELAERVAVESQDGEDGAFVLGRLCETLGILARSAAVDVPETICREFDEPGEPSAVERPDEPFAVDRIEFARSAASPHDRTDVDLPATIGTVEGIEATTDDAVEAMTAPDDACPDCGIARPPQGPPVCPGCGAPF